MRYQDFIGELRTLLATADRLARANLTHEEPDFRNWRYRVESLVTEAKASGYRLPGEFRSTFRMYGATRGDPNRGRAEFQSEMKDSTIELRFLIEHYEKYGQAEKESPNSQPASTLEPPERVTPAWLFKNVPVHIWAYGVGLLLVAFSVGVTVSRTGLYDTVAAWFSSSEHEP